MEKVKELFEMCKKHVWSYKGILYIVILMWIAAGVQLLVNEFYISDKRVMEAFIDTESNMEQSQLEVAADCGSRFFSEDDKKQLIQYMASKIGLEEPYSFEYQTSEQGNSLVATKSGKNADTFISVVTTKEAKQYILIRLTLYEKGEHILKYKEIITRMLSELKVEEKQSLVTFTGTYEGQLSEKERKKEVDSILNRLQADIISESQTEGTYSVYAYTGLVKEYIEVGEKWININIVMVYDEEKQETKLYLATPILNKDY